MPVLYLNYRVPKNFVSFFFGKFLDFSGYSCDPNGDFPYQWIIAFGIVIKSLTN